MISSNKYSSLREQAKNLLDGNAGEVVYLPSHVATLIQELTCYQIELELQNEELTRTQAELDGSRTKFVSLYENAPIGYFNIDQNGIILHANQAAANLLQMTICSLAKRSFSQYISPPSQKTFLDHRNEVLKTMALQTCELQIINKNGLILTVQVDSVAIEGSVSSDKEFLTFVTDITARKKAEEIFRSQQAQLFSEDRSTTLNEFATRVANELNEPLTVVANYLNGSIIRLEKLLPEDKSIINAMKKAVTSLDSANTILQNIKNYKSKRMLTKEEVNFDLFMQSNIKLLTFETSTYPVKIYYEVKGLLPTVWIDKAQIQQVILNLTRNAFEAMRDADTIQPHIFIEVRQTADNLLQVEVTDNGPGMEKNIKSKLFSLQATTKSYGMGLGLIISKGIIEAHGGTLSLNSSVENTGCCFSFTLPLTD